MSNENSLSVTICLFLTALDTVLESLLILIGPLELHLAHLLVLQTGIDDFSVNLGLILLDCIVQILSGFWGKERATANSLLKELLFLLFKFPRCGIRSSLHGLVSLILGFHIIVGLVDWVVNIFIEEIVILVSSLSLGASLELFLDFLLEIIVHDEVCGASQHEKLGCSFLISAGSMVLFLGISGRFDYGANHLKMRPVHVKHLDIT